MRREEGENYIIVEKDDEGLVKIYPLESLTDLFRNDYSRDEGYVIQRVVNMMEGVVRYEVSKAGELLKRYDSVSEYYLTDLESAEEIELRGEDLEESRY